MGNPHRFREEVQKRGIGEKIAQMLFTDKLSCQTIVNKLKTDYDLEVSVCTMGNYKRFILDSVPGMLERDEEYRDKLAKIYLDSRENLVYLINKIKEDIEKYPDTKQWKQRATFYATLVPIMNILAKRSGDIKPPQFIKQELTINNIQINQMVQEEITRLIDSGKINLEACGEEVKQFYRKIKATI